MLAGERRLRVLEQVAERQVVSVSELAGRFGVSEMTIRRDIRRLERDGFLRQSYGGATAHVTRSLELAISARALRYATEKRLIALDAVTLLGSAQTLFIGAGSTCEQFARFLPPVPNLTVVTSSLSIASLLGTRPASTNVIILGGTVTRDELMVKGALASFVLGRFHFELAVVGAAAVSARWGVADLDMELAEINHQAIELADRTMVLANGAKIGSSAPALVVSLSSIEVLVTDLSAPEEELAAIRAQNVITRVVARPSPEGVAAAAHLPAPDGSRTARARQRA